MVQLGSHVVLEASPGKCGHQAAVALAPGHEHSLSACTLGWLAGTGWPQARGYSRTAVCVTETTADHVEADKK